MLVIGRRLHPEGRQPGSLVVRLEGELQLEVPSAFGT